MRSIVSGMVCLVLSLNRFAAQTMPGDRINDDALKMTFPSIYFKHNSIDYATMPYPPDSCFKYIAANMKTLNSYPVWRDSSEKESLTVMRIKKLRSELNKYAPARKIKFQSMGSAQKVSGRTIRCKTNPANEQYLLSLNSVFDLSGMLHQKGIGGKAKKQRKKLPRLVWCGWNYGFHWSSPGSTVKKISSLKKLHFSRKINKTNLNAILPIRANTVRAQAFVLTGTGIVCVFKKTP